MLAGDRREVRGSTKGVGRKVRRGCDDEEQVRVESVGTMNETTHFIGFSFPWSDQLCDRLVHVGSLTDACQFCVVQPGSTRLDE